VLPDIRILLYDLGDILTADIFLVFILLQKPYSYDSSF